MYITDDGIRLKAILERPEKADGKVPMVIILHGFTGHMEEQHLVGLAGVLHEAGYATLRADLYGHGGSDGAFREHTLFKWMTNAMTLVDYARGLEDVGDIYLCGHSQGGLTAILTAALEHDRIKGLIALAPAVMIPELARKGGLLGTQFDPDNPPEEMTVWGDFVLGSNYTRVAQTIHAEEAIDRYDGPVLIVQGTDDMPDLAASAKAAADRYRHCDFVQIEGDTHTFDRHLDQMTEAVRTWIVAH